MHLRPPAISHGVISFIWALVFFLYVWWGGVAVGVHGGTAFIFGAVVGFLVFVIIAGVYGAATVSTRILVTQALPAALALTAVLVAG